MSYYDSVGITYDQDPDLGFSKEKKTTLTEKLTVPTTEANQNCIII